MNRTGLIIALVLGAIIALALGLWPQIDLWAAALFFDPQTKTFPLKYVAFGELLRNLAMVVSWTFVVPAIMALIVKAIYPQRPLFMSGRAAIFLIVTIALSAGILSNLTFKTFWGRPRPVLVTEFGGPMNFVPWWDPRGTCTRNCSFFSGEGATAFWTYAPAALAPPHLRPAAYAVATVFGLATGGWRMAFGGHFLSDVLLSGVASFLVIWLVHGLIYRWRWSRTTDEQVDATLTRLFWPGYRWSQRVIFGRDVGRMATISTAAARLDPPG